MEYTSDQLNEIFEKLPEALKDAIVSVDNAKTISEIGRKYGLHIDQTGEMAEEVGSVLLGLAHPTELVNNLTRRLGIERVIASQVAAEINEEIFLKIREYLKSEPEIGVVRSQPQGVFAPVRDALLAAIEKPHLIEMSTRHEINRPADSDDILTQKLSGQFSLPPVESTKKIDQYREQVN